MAAARHAHAVWHRLWPWLCRVGPAQLHGHFLQFGYALAGDTGAQGITCSLLDLFFGIASRGRSTLIGLLSGRHGVDELGKELEREDFMQSLVTSVPGASQPGCKL